MDKYVIYREFNKLKFTTLANYSARIMNTAIIVDFSNFRDEEHVRQYLINNLKLLEEQIIIIR